MSEKRLTFGKKNYIICAVSVLIVFIGFILMTGSASTIEDGYQPDIFSNRRVVIAPMTCFVGFLLMIVGILYPSKQENTNAKSH